MVGVLPLASPHRQVQQRRAGEAPIREAHPAEAVPADPRLGAAVRQLHVNLGHPSNVALARCIRLSGGTDEAIQAALRHRCSVCARLAPPASAIPAKIREAIDFGEIVAVDLFQLADWRGYTVTFHNAVDLGSTFTVVAPVSSKRPQDCIMVFNSSWCGWAGPPRRVVMDQGGEFMREYGEGLEDLGTRVSPCAAISPTQNAVAERSGGAWKAHARAIIDEFNLDFRDPKQVWWLCTCINWAMNNYIDESGYSASQWVLGKGIVLPFNLMTQHTQLALHSRHARDRSFA